VGDHVFAGASLTTQQHRRVRGRDPLDLVYHPAERGARADDLLGAGGLVDRLAQMDDL
jgi:hypothetical protein